jgi:Flp pilus assembly pilin Flp
MVATCIAAVIVAAASNVGQGVLDLFKQIHF